MPSSPDRTDLNLGPELCLTPQGSQGVGLFQELYAYRDLYLLLAWRNLAVRYKQTVFGVVWAMVQPLVASGIFTVFLGLLAKVPSNGQPYALFSLTGMLLWISFQNAVSGAAGSLVENSSLVTKIYFPRLMIPGATVTVAVADFAVSSLALIAALVLYQVPMTPGMLLAPLFALATFLFAFGFGVGLAAVNVRFRDVRFVVPFFLQCWMFASPVVYPASVVPAHLRPWLGLNPMAGFLSGFRASILGTPIPWEMVAVSSASALTLCFLSILVYRNMEASLADLI